MPKTTVPSEWLGDSLYLSTGNRPCLLRCLPLLRMPGGVQHPKSFGRRPSLMWVICPKYFHLVTLILSITGSCLVSALISAYVTLLVQCTASILCKQLDSECYLTLIAEQPHFDFRSLFASHSRQINGPVSLLNS